MSNAILKILGSGSAMPTLFRQPSAQVLTLRNKELLIDCGEGTQLQLRKYKARFSKINHIFISHAHGDHCLGLPGFLSTLSMLGHNGTIVIHAPERLREFCDFIIRYFGEGINFPLIFEPVPLGESCLIYEDRTMTVHSLPLIHREPAVGFLFREKPHLPHLNREALDRFGIPIAYFNRIKNGEDYVTPEGELILNSELTFEADQSISYAYCSDTMFNKRLVPLLSDVDVLYHEATYTEEFNARAKATTHSTAKQAATIAKESGVKKLLIGHYSSRYISPEPLLKEAQEVFPNTTAVKDGDVITIE